MFDDMVNLFNLGAFSDEEKELLRTDFTERALQVFVIRIPFRGFVLKTLPQMAMY